jgi:hypothetical protein
MKTVQLSDSQIVSINVAIMLLKQSNSDHAEQALFHLESIIKQVKKD